MKKRHLIELVLILCLVFSQIPGVAMALNGLFNDPITNEFQVAGYVGFSVFFFLTAIAFSCIVMSHRIISGKPQEILFIVCCLLLIDEIIAYLIFAFIEAGFDFSTLDWIGALTGMASSWKYYLTLGIGFVVLFVIYILIVNRQFVAVLFKGGSDLKQVKGGNLENSRWLNDKEKRKIFKYYKYSELANVKKDGIPVAAGLDRNEKDMEVGFNSPCHSIIIGSTGSGKTTTFVSPMIQLLASTAAGSSMVITDPKGELFMLHSKFLHERGYDVKVIDLRDTYSSYRWNPLDAIWENFQDYKYAYKKAFKHKGNILASGLKLDKDAEKLPEDEVWYEFDGKAYASYQRLISAIKSYKKKIFDEVYEDLNDLVTVLIPVENEKDPLWEKGARSIALAVLLAMLEDSLDDNLGMTKEKFNFFNLTKILQNSTNDYQDLRDYFKGRSPLSRALSLSKQVCDAAPTTRASYMSIVYDKMMLFNDAGVCALTSESDFSAGALSDHPTALFLKIPDEKDTRHNLAAIFILNIYKTLIKVASASEGLTLPRNVYFIMDEFGNMPKISKFDKFITVGRSRKIWFTMIVQSYAQLNNVYGDNVAEIVKGNCGIKMFIGSNDMQTCKEYSELCGNITVATTSTSASAHSDVNYSTSYQVRPLIYPSELQRLNHPGDIGHGIIVTFGNFPLKTFFTPSFKVPLYKMGEMDQSELEDRSFNESEVYYDIRKRNDAHLERKQAPAAEEEKANKGKKKKTDMSQADLLNAFMEYSKTHPNITIKEFTEMLSKGEIDIGKESK